MNKQTAKVRVVVMCCPGRFQSYLLHRLVETYEVKGVIYCDAGPASHSLSERLRHYAGYLNPTKLIRYIYSRVRLPKYEQEAERRMQANYPEFYSRQRAPENLLTLTVSNINDPQVSKFLADINIDMVVVNGTNLIREPLLSQCLDLEFGIINLHTGLSPYTRGGNCNLYALLELRPEWIGATIHYIDRGIDSGDIIQTLRPVMCSDDPFEYIDAMVFIEGIEALVQSVAMITEGESARVKQWQSGALYLARTGYHYEPYQRLRANQLIEKGLLIEYLAEQVERDANIRLVR